MSERAAILVQACLNGSRRPSEHEALPVTPAALAEDAGRVVAAGAAAVHVHPRGPDGAETLDPVACAAAVEAIRAKCPGLPIGLTTGSWIEPDPARRLALVGAWTTRPDFVSVNWSEEGATELCELLLRLGVGIEAGLWTADDAEPFVGSPLADRCLRVLVEATQEDPAAATATALAIDAVLDRARAGRPRLHHGEGLGTWAVLDAALRRGHDIRIGLEDTLQRPDGQPARGNAELVELAVALLEKHGRRPASLPPDRTPPRRTRPLSGS